MSEDKTVKTKVVEEIKRTLCEGEVEAFKICNEIGQRNYKNSYKYEQEVNYEPVECKIFEENQNKCFQFWDRVSIGGRTHLFFECGVRCDAMALKFFECGVRCDAIALRVRISNII